MYNLEQQKVGVDNVHIIEGNNPDSKIGSFNVFENTEIKTSEPGIPFIS